MIALKNELIKLFSKKKYIVFIVIAAAVVLIRFLGTAIFSGMISWAANNGFSLGKGMASVYDMISFNIRVFTPFVVFLAVSDLFSAEIQEDTIKSVLSQPVTRGQVLAVKTVAALIMGCVCYFSMYIICLIMQIISGGGFNNAATVLLAYVLDIIPLITLITMSICLNLLIKGPALSLLVSVIAYLALTYLSYYNGTVSPFVFTSYLEWHKLLIGSTVPVNVILSRLGILAGSVLILYSISYIMFENTDF